jgi:F0F1-type ATP synthase assembly protein I
VIGSSDNRQPPLVVALRWVHQISAVSLEMVLPIALGYYLDQRWGTEPWLVIVGTLFGFLTAMVHLLQMTGVIGRPRSSVGDDSKS